MLPLLLLLLLLLLLYADGFFVGLILHPLLFPSWNGFRFVVLIPRRVAVRLVVCYLESLSDRSYSTLSWPVCRILPCRLETQMMLGLEVFSNKRKFRVKPYIVVPQGSSSFISEMEAIASSPG